MRTCTIDGCDKPHRARGLCSTHYNHAHQPARHAPREVDCTVCGERVLRRFKSDRRPVCSVACRAQLTNGSTEGDGYNHVRDGMARARAAGATVIEPVDRFAVFERDAWTCYLCGTVLDPQADPFDLLSATVDHVVPLSQGGRHAMDNVRCACLGCNSRKQNHAAA